MSTVTGTDLKTLADLMDRIGNVSPERILMDPPPTTATEADVIRLEARADKRLCELIEGVLVEKAMGTRESLLAMFLGQTILNFLDEHDLGYVVGADGPLRLMEGLVRIPDVAFISHDRIPGDEFPDDPVLAVAPDLAVEILSPGNTPKEMERKAEDYFEHGVRLFWIIDPKTQTAEVYHSATDVKQIEESGTLDGEDVLPGFLLPLRELFARLRRPPRK